MTRTSLLSLAVVALLGAALVAGCGGDSGGDEDPQQVLDETFSNDQTINSGVLDLSLSVSAEGDEGGSLDASLSGPFQGDEQQEGEFPQFDLTVDASGEGGGQEFDFEGGFLATSDAAFVSYQDETYEVPSAFFNQIKKTSERAQRQARQQGNGEDAGAVFEQLGIDPSGWLTNLENEGDEDVEGTETIQIHGDADVAAIVEDIQGAAEQAGGEAIDPDQTAEIEESVDEASIDVYSGKEDRILRRLDLNLALSPSEDATVDNVEIEFALTLSDVNEDQTIEAPSDAQPFSQLEQALGLPSGILEGALGGELGSGGGGLGESLGGGGGGGGGAGGGGAGGGGAGGNEIAECLQNATSEEEINDCLTQ